MSSIVDWSAKKSFSALALSMFDVSIFPFTIRGWFRVEVVFFVLYREDTSFHQS